MVERGRSVITVSALNDLASQATSNATARGIFEFVVFAVDDQSPELAATIALAPTADVETTLPMMLALAVDGARFATEEVLQASAKRCSSNGGIEFARSLLKHPTLGQALGDDYEDWLLGLLRQFGSAIWLDVSQHIENWFGFDVTTRFLGRLNLDKGEEATFLARYYFLFIESRSAHEELLENLAGHLDWRVRMALAQGLLQGGHGSADLVRQITDRLAGDADYKVRAAVAKTLGHNGQAVAHNHVADLLTDPNWHVRACVLDGTYLRQLTASEAGLTGDTLDIVRGDPSWRTCPDHIAKLLERLHLLNNASNTSGNGDARAHALFGLLRELRTGWINVPPATRAALVGEGLESPSWLVRKEATTMRDIVQRLGQDSQLDTPPTLRQTFRRLRDGRSIQVALDLHDLDQAVEVAIAAAGAGADLIEVGDPLIKTIGLRAVEIIKRSVPDTTIVAEMMSADWGRDQVQLAAEAGADVVLLIGPATTASVSAAVDAGRRLGVPILLDVPTAHTTQIWVRDMERAGVDGFTITTNIDLGVGVHPPLTKAHTVRGWTRLPVAVSGGFSATDYAILDSADWDIMIVGRSVAEAVHRPKPPARSSRWCINAEGGNRVIVTPLRQDMIPSVVDLMDRGVPHIKVRTYSDYWLYARLFSSSCPVALEGEHVAGAVMAFRSQEDPDDVYVQDVMTHPDNRRKGVAKALLEAVRRQAVTWGSTRLYLTSEPDNAAANASWTTLGFTNVPGDQVVNGVSVITDFKGPGKSRAVYELRLP